MGTGNDRVGKVLRFIASGGMADEDPDIVAELLLQAHQMADLVMRDESASPELRGVAGDFLEQLSSDTFDHH